jgi:hypothetical protein
MFFAVCAEIKANAISNTPAICTISTAVIAQRSLGLFDDLSIN